MSKPLQSSWKLTDTPLSREEFIKAFQDFEYFTSGGLSDFSSYSKW